jgi:hypothetical protein
MTTVYAASDVADSFEDLSSLSSDKDIESLVLATTYDDDDDDNDLGNNTKSADDSSNNSSKTSVPAKEEEEQEGEENQKVDKPSSDDEDLVDLAGADVEDDEDENVLSEGWESTRSTTPEPQGSHQGLSSCFDLSLPEKQMTSPRPHDIDSANDSKDSTAAEKAMTNTSTNANTIPTPMTSSPIPRIRIRLTSDIFAEFNKPSPSKSVMIASSLPPDRVAVTSSRLRLAGPKATKISTTSVTATPESGNVTSPRDQKDMEPKKAVLITLPTTPPDTTTTTDNAQTQEEGDSKCMAIRRSTGKRCIRKGRHNGYCRTHWFACSEDV